MYLLNPFASYARDKAAEAFTFHYVSIKSAPHPERLATMYLLNRYISKITNDEYKFTFHYVSIKSNILFKNTFSFM